MEHTLGKRIAAHRKKMGLTQDALAEKLGVTAQAVSKWENDQSCPDITTLPKLAEIFNTTTDALLGIVHEIAKADPVVEDSAPEERNSDEKVFSGNWEFKYDNTRRSGIFFAIFVLLVGGVYLVSSLSSLDISLWEIAWPTALLIWGCQAMYPKFSFFGLGCAVFGGFNLINLFIPMPLQLDSGVIVAVIILLIGGTILMEALKKPRKPTVTFFHNRNSGEHSAKNHFHIHETSFQFDGAFGDDEHLVRMPLLSSGMINTSCGDFEIDLSGVEEVTPGCRIEANTSYGDLTIYVPSKFEVQYSSETACASVEIEGKPDAVPAGRIQLNANVSFGSICVEYI